MIRMIEVAERCGASETPVFHVVKGTRYATLGTRRQVKQAIRDRGFYTNATSGGYGFVHPGPLKHRGSSTLHRARLGARSRKPRGLTLLQSAAGEDWVVGYEQSRKDELSPAAGGGCPSEPVLAGLRTPAHPSLRRRVGARGLVLASRVHRTVDSREVGRLRPACGRAGSGAAAGVTVGSWRTVLAVNAKSDRLLAWYCSHAWQSEARSRLALRRAHPGCRRAR